MIWVAIGIVVAWVACGVLDYGLSLAYWQGKFPAISQETYRQDVRVSFICAIFGPISLVSSLLLYDGLKYGWRIR